jgi:hypothetical protein
MRNYSRNAMRSGGERSMATVRIMIMAALLFAGLGRAPALEAPGAQYPELPRWSASAEDFVPPGWVAEASSKGDLNGDKRPDLLLVLKQNDPSFILSNEPDSPGISEVDANPRVLVIAFARKAGGYDLVRENRDFIPRYQDPTIEDPFGYAEIANGAFKVGLHYWANAGSWYTSSRTFVFKYQEKAFRLVALTDYTTKRNTGQSWDLSLDYVKRRAIMVAGNFSNDDGKDKKLQRALPREKPLMIEDLGCGWDFEPKQRQLDWWGLEESQFPSDGEGED